MDGDAIPKHFHSSPERLAAKRAGLATFTLSVPCRRGHYAPRWTASGTCTVCKKLRDRAITAGETPRAKAPKAETDEQRLARKREVLRASRAANPVKQKAHRRKQHERMKALGTKAAYERAYVAAKPEKKAAWDRAYRERNAEKIKARRTTPEARRRINERQMARYYSDRNHRLRCILRANVRQALRLHGNGSKTTATMKLVGCSTEELAAHLEAQFRPGMTWDNYGEWEIDHRIPCAAFDLTDPEQQRACFCWSNLQPLWKSENRRKNARLDWQPAMAAE